MEQVIAHHQIVLTFASGEQFDDAVQLAEEALNDDTVMRKEVNYMFEFLSEFGDIVDMNFDYFPERIIVTYSKHEHIRALLRRETLTYSTTKCRAWKFNLDKIRFVQPVRNCNFADDSTPIKYLPIYLSQEKLQFLMTKNQ